VLRTPDTPASSPGTCDVAELGTCLQLTVRGRPDPAALAAAARGIELSPGRVLVLDLCGATLVDPAVVQFALGLHRRALAHGTALVVVGRPRTRELFAQAGAAGVTIVEDAAGAVTTRPAS
jgi:anti-anti-sigma regulatory factor